MNHEYCYRRTVCRLCLSERLEVFLPLAAAPVADAYVKRERLNIVQESFPLDLCLCLNCGHVQLSCVVNPEHIYRDYLYVTRSSPGLANYYAAYAASMADFARPPRNSLVLDIGSNDGALLLAFKNLGFKPLGVDPARDIADRASQNGLPTIPEFLTPELALKIRETQGPAALVTANNIAANVDDLISFFEAVGAVLADDGLFVMESGYWLDIVNNMLFDTVYHEHLSYFSILPLLSFVRKTCFELIHVFHSESKGGCLRYIFAKRSGRLAGARSKELLAFEAEERRVKLDSLETNRAYARRVEERKIEVNGLLGRLKKEGRKIAAYGASNTTTTMFYHLGLNEYIDYLVDDNPVKIGLFSPGRHLPVLAPEELLKRQPDYVFIAAWRFWKLIVERQEAGFGGGVPWRWIIPLPELSVIGR